MRAGDLIRFKRSGKLGTIVSMKKWSHYTVIKILHNVEGILNPSLHTIGELRRTAEVINESSI